MHVSAEAKNEFSLIDTVVSLTVGAPLRLKTLPVKLSAQKVNNCIRKYVSFIKSPRYNPVYIKNIRRKVNYDSQGAFQ